MRRHYRMHICVSPLTPVEASAVLDTISDQWSRPEQVRRLRQEGHVFVEASAEGFLKPGESEERFAQRITTAIWRKLGHFTKVTVEATCLEEPPNQSYELGMEEYERMINRRRYYSTL